VRSRVFYEWPLGTAGRFVGSMGPAYCMKKWVECQHERLRHVVADREEG
jgi:hypothetical protein